MVPSSRDAERGLSIIELLIVVVISALIVIALTMFVGRGFIVSREQFEQVRITEDARIELERMSEAIRDAQYVEIDNQPGTDTNTLERNIQLAKSNELIMYANIDNDEEVEKVRYFIDPNNPTELRRTFVEPPYSGGESSPVILVRSLRNSGSEPLFQYYSAGGESELIPSSELTATQLSRLGRVRLRLIIDVNTTQDPPAADIFTEATPRSVLTPNCFGDDCPVPACPGTSVTLAPFESDDTLAITTAYDECPSRCGGCPSDVSLTQSGNFIYPRCYCGQTSLPYGHAQCVAGTLANCEYEENVAASDYTEFYLDCWAGTTLNGTIGKPYCSSPGSNNLGDCVCLP
ncbi:MAG: hypothetical protein WD972_01845 [Candidatus Andersenbacteria bacterium]